MRFRMDHAPDFSALRFDWNRARAFLVTAETGSLTAAARALRVAQPTLGRQVAALEAELGVTLFERLPRGLRLTEAGLAMLDHVREMGAAAGRLSLAAGGQVQALEGLVTITASELIAACHLPRVLATIRESAPALRVEIVADNDIRDLRRREADIAIRNHRPAQPELIARKLRDEEVGLFASADYAARLGEAGLESADFIGYDTTPTLARALAGMGLSVPEDRFRLVSGNHLVVLAMLRAGLGVAVMSARALESEPGIVRLGEGLAPFSYPVWLTAHRELHSSARIRHVFDAIARHL